MQHNPGLAPATPQARAPTRARVLEEPPLWEGRPTNTLREIARLDVEAPGSVLIDVSAAFPVLPVPFADQVIISVRTIYLEVGVPGHRLPVPDYALQAPRQQPAFAARRAFLVQRGVGCDLEEVGTLGLEDPHLQLAASRDSARVGKSPPVRSVLIGAQAVAGGTDPVGLGYSGAGLQFHRALIEIGLGDLVVVGADG